jgi:hypothetical protein
MWRGICWLGLVMKLIMTGNFYTGELMKLKYCRHCKRNVPMFDDEEYERLLETYRLCIDKIKEYRRIHKVSFNEMPTNDLYQPFFKLYREISNMDAEFTVEEIVQRHYFSRWKEYKEL